MINQIRQTTREAAENNMKVWDAYGFVMIVTGLKQGVKRDEKGGQCDGGGSFCGKSKGKNGRGPEVYSPFQEVMQIEHPSTIERDAAIHRFKIAFEVIWKSAKEVLYEHDGIDAGSPKGVIRSCRELGVLDEEEAVTALEMVDDRNLSVHTYNEKLAVEIYGRLRAYETLMGVWLERLSGRIG